MAMSRSTLNFWVDAALLLIFLALLSVAGIMLVVFPSPTEAEGWRLWGRGYEVWVWIQAGLLGLFALGVLLHLILHWSWVCGYIAHNFAMFKGKPAMTDGIKTLYGVGVLVVAITLVAGIIGWAEFEVRAPRVQPAASEVRKTPQASALADDHHDVVTGRRKAYTDSCQFDSLGLERSSHDKPILPGSLSGLGLPDGSRLGSTLGA